MSTILDTLPQIVTTGAYVCLLGVHFDLQRNELNRRLTHVESDRFAAAAYAALAANKVIYMFF